MSSDYYGKEYMRERGGEGVNTHSRVASTTYYLHMYNTLYNVQCTVQYICQAYMLCKCYILLIYKI
jgi:hypothetical protein